MITNIVERPAQPFGSPYLPLIGLSITRSPHLSSAAERIVIEVLVQKRRNRALDETLTTAISALVDIDCRQPAASWRAQLRAALRRDGSLAGRCRNRCRSTSPAIPKGPRLADGNRRAVPKPQAFFITSRVAVVLRAASAGPGPAAEGARGSRLP